MTQKVHFEAILEYGTQLSPTILCFWMLLPYLALRILERSMGVKRKVLSDGQPPTVEFAVLVQLCSPKAKDAETKCYPFHQTAKNGYLTLNNNIFIEMACSR